jgi:PAS domain S-box-containing protein
MGPFKGWKMTEHTSVQALFDSWVESKEPASMHTSFLYHHWMEQMDVQVIAHRPDGTIVYANQPVADLLGRRRSEVHGRPIEELFGAQWSTAHMEHVAAATPSTGAVLSELRFDLDGGRHFEITTTVIFTSEDNPGLVGLVMKDTTGLVDARNELHELNQRLRESNRDLEDFAYVASHDLQEPLRKISAFGERLRVRLGDDVDEKSLDYLDRMEGASRRMQVLINDLLSFSRVTTKGTALVPVDLGDVVDNVLHDLEIAIADSGAVVHRRTLPTIDADALQLRQLFQNLIGNALKFHVDGRPPEIWVEAVMIGGRWLLSVRDNGIGFDQAYAEKIFTVFQRLHGRSEYDGTGVGLAICRKIVERHGGTIRATSDDDHGATFLIDLPRSVGDLQAAA